MAIDTAAKRYSMLNLGDGTTTAVLPIPDGTLGVGDFEHLLDLYSGVTGTGVAKTGADSATLAESVVLTVTVVAGDTGVLASVLTLAGIYTATDTGTLAGTGSVSQDNFVGEAIGRATITARPASGSVAIEA